MSQQKRFRYPGLNSFTEGDEDIFCGREKDSIKLFTQILISPTLVLHAESGTGKSSLVQAGLLPLIKKQQPDYIPVVIRFKFLETTKPELAAKPLLEQVYFEIKEHLQSNQKPLPFLENAAETLWLLAKKLSRGNDSSPPRKLLLIFDQFEEFQLYPQSIRNEFKKALAELMSIDIPPDCYQLMVKGIATALDKKELLPEARQQFNDSLLFLKSPLEARLLFVIREDKLGTMTLLSDFFPDILRNDMILHPLTRENAFAAIMRPCLADGSFESPKFAFDNEELVKTLIEKIAENDSIYVDPLQVQIICNNIEKKVIEDLNPFQKTKFNILNSSALFKRIKEKDIPEITDVVINFYKDTWGYVYAALCSAYGEEKIASAYDLIRKNIITELVINEHRVMVSQEKLTQHSQKEYELIISLLVNKGLLRAIPTGGDTYLQLCHDRFVKPVYEDLVQIRAIEQDETDRLRLQNERIKKRQKEKQRWYFILGFLFVTIFGLSTYLYFNNGAKIIVQKQRILDISRIASRSNPQLGFLIAQNWIDEYGKDKSFEDLVNSIDSSNQIKQSGIFYSPSTPVDIDITGDTLKLLSRSIFTTWRVDTRMILNHFAVPRGAFIKRFKTSTGDRFLFQNEKHIELCDAELHSLLMITVPEITSLTVVQPSPRGGCLLVGTKMYTLTDGHLIGVLPKLPISGFGPVSAVFFKNESYVIVAYPDGYKVIYNVPQSHNTPIRPVLIFPPSKLAEITVMDVDISGRYLVAGNNKKEVEVWNIPAGKRLDGHQILTDIQLITAAKSKSPYCLFKGHSDVVTNVAISGNGAYVLSGSRDHFGIVWDIRNRKKVSVLKDLGSPVTYTGIDYSGGQLTTANDDGDVFIWNRAPGITLYHNKRLNQFSPFDYYNAGLDRSDQVLNQFYAHSNITDTYAKAFNYISNLPKKNPYPNDNYYLNNLKTAYHETDSLYQELNNSAGYSRDVSPLQQSTLRQIYEQLQSRKKSLLYEPMSDDPQIQHQETGEQLKYNITKLIENTDLNSINTAVNYAENLVDLSKYYRDTLEKPKYRLSLSYLSNGLTLIEAFRKKHENDPDLDYMYTILSYNKALSHLYMKEPDSARLEANKFNLYQSGQGLANMVYIMIYLCENKYEPAERLFRDNENKVVLGGNDLTESLKAHLTFVLFRLRARGISTPATVSFLGYLHGRETPQKLIKPSKKKRSSSKNNDR